MILILPAQEHSTSFHVFMSSFISFFSILCFSEYRSFASLGQFILRYFILFVAIVNVIVSLISFSVFSLLVYRNARNFCVLILYPATLLSSLISSRNFLVALLGFSMYSIMSYVNRVLPLFLQSGSLLFSFPLIAMARTSKNIFNDNGGSGNPYLVPDLRGIPCSFYLHFCNN